MEKRDKFLFDTEFDVDSWNPRGLGVLLEEDEVLTKRHLDDARAEGYAAGKAAGRTEAEGESSRMAAQALEKFTRDFAVMKQAHANALAHHTREATALAVAVAKKLAPALMAAQPLAEIEALITDCLSRIMGEARVVVRVHNDLVEGLDQRVDALTKQMGFDGHVILLGEDGLGPGDCRVEWADGGAERSTASLAKALDEAINRLVQAGVADATQDLADEPVADSANVVQPASQFAT
jgi:flagellar assembly protein FliH